MSRSFILLFVLFSCISNSYVEAPEDFYFEIVTPVDKFNLKQAIFTRRYHQKDSLINLLLSNKEVNIIYQSLINNKLDKVPINYKPDCKIIGTPTFFTKVYVHINGSKRVYVYNPEYKCTRAEDVSNLSNIKKFIESINDILNKKEEIIKMPKTDIVFL